MNKLLEEMMIKSTEDMPSVYYIPPQYFQKFAELIIRDCLDMFVEEHELEQKVLEHFGINEIPEIVQ